MTAAELAYRTTDDTADLRNELVMSELSQVYYSARRIRERLPQRVELEDLVQAGVLGLMDAASKFDEAKDVKFSTFAKFRINGAILDSLRKLDWCSRTLRRRGRAINQASMKIGAELGRQATHDEIAAHLGMSFDELHDTFTQLNSFQVVSQMAESAGGPDAGLDLIESAPDRGEHDAFELCLKGENRALLITALELLTDREQKIIQLYYEEELTMREIAAILGLVVTRISQIHAAALAKLRRSIEQAQRPKLVATQPTVFSSKPRNISAMMRQA
jgi:RNA polymerase sigma factor for flagellar operon FliA